MARLVLDSPIHQRWRSTTAGEASPTIVAASLGDAEAALAELQRRMHHARWAGFFNYDLGQCFESLPRRASNDLNVPLLSFAQAVSAPMPGPSEASPGIDHAQSSPLQSTFTRGAYEHAVQRCIDYIAAGDVFQVNLSQRFAVPIADEPWAIYQRLRQQHPAEFGAFLDFGRFQLISNSPELFLRVEKLTDGRRRIVNRPIKGTRPNQPGMHESLQHSEKDQAELAMIVDLQRNDLGRICEVGSVRVTQSRVIETHPTVLHGVATVEGVLRDGMTLRDILAATFPCGSVTGCPKIRAMQIIDELEPVRRGAYCGAIGWIDGDEMELSVAIRTMTIQDGVAYVPVGGGVVADSSPAAEYEETLVKAQAMFAALGV